MSQYYSLNDTIYFGVTTHNPSGGALINADVTPRWYAYRNTSDAATQAGDFAARSGLVGTYRGSLVISTGNGFAANDYVELHASGAINGIVGRSVFDSFVINDVYDVNVTQVSGVLVNVNDFKFSESNIYFADLKYLRDMANNRDEYSCQWYKNDQPVSSGSLTNPALSVYNTSDGTSVLLNKSMFYSSLNLGSVRYNDTSLPASGEPYLAMVSGTIDGSTRTWNKIIGLDIT